jgi:hypothetical protein
VSFGALSSESVSHELRANERESRKPNEARSSQSKWFRDGEIPGNPSINPYNCPRR